MQLNRVVFDTNIWVTYFYNGELPELVHIVEDLEISVYSSERLHKELYAVLKRPKLIRKLNLPPERYIRFFARLSTKIEIDERFDRVTDINDNYIVDIAYTAKCSHIITGDPHLLSLKHVGVIQIISLADFRKMVRDLLTKLRN